MDINKEYYEYLTKKIDEIIKKELPVLNVDVHQDTEKCLVASTECLINQIDISNTVVMMASELINQLTNKMAKDGLIPITELEVYLDLSMFKMNMFAVYTFANFAKPKSRIDITVPGWIVLDNRDILKGTL